MNFVSSFATFSCLVLKGHILSSDLSAPRKKPIASAFRIVRAWVYLDETFLPRITPGGILHNNPVNVN